MLIMIAIGLRYKKAPCPMATGLQSFDLLHVSREILIYKIGHLLQSDEF